MTRSATAATGAVCLSLFAALSLSGCGQSAEADPGAQDDKAGKPAGAQIKVLSNRPDLISGGDALVEVVLPAGATDAKVTLNDVDVSDQFALRVNDRYMGRLTGLVLGTNKLVVKAPGAPAAHARITNYPNGGPVFSGPQVQPWRCQTGAVDAQCNQPAEYTYLYKSTDPNKPGLRPYDPENPPSDVAMTTLEDGTTTLRFIVRQELGYQDRDQYKILTLFRPDADWQPWSPQDQWNRKVLITHGGGCGAAHGAGSAPLKDFSGTFEDNPAMSDSYVVALGRGFAVLSTALDNLGHNCNVVLAAESLVMAKERLIEQYGPIRYTIGTGCSGGSITQMMVANAYPGVYQGSITTCAYPDVFSTGAQFADLHLLRLYFEPSQTNGSVKWGPGVVWTEDQMAEVEGHVAHVNAIATDELFFKGVTAPTGECAGKNSEGGNSYDPDTNQDGVRCGLMDFMVNVLGTRAPEVWSPMEIAAGHGFAGNPIDNVGIQYGLNALRKGRITPAQFVDLNSKIGGLDIDIQLQASRTAADQPALPNVYRSSALNSANNLNRLAIINVAGPDPGAAHDTVHGFWTRWRIDREHGNHNNHVVWVGPVALAGDVKGMENGLLAMDRWLTAVEQDTSAMPLADKLTRYKPDDVHDQCTDGYGHGIAGPDGTAGPECVTAMEKAIAYSSPRAVAGGPKEDDRIKCVLKPLNREDDYGPLGMLTFTDDQWAQLQAAFPDGACDYSQPGVDQQGAVAWMTYQDAAGNVIYGGTPLPPAPVGVAPGWTSAAFSPE